MLKKQNTFQLESLKIILLLKIEMDISINSIILKSKLVVKIINNRKNKKHMKLLRYLITLAHTLLTASAHSFNHIMHILELH